MSKYSFLSFVYIAGDKKIYELVEFEDEVFLNFKLRYVTEEGLTEVWESQEVKKDFSLSEGYLLWSGESSEISDSEYENFKGREVNISAPNNHLYVWLWDLVKMGARILTDSAFKYITETGTLPDEGVANMSTIRVSRSTMRVYVSMLAEGGWFSQTLVGMEGNLNFNPFYFMIEKHKADTLTIDPSIKLQTTLTLGAEEFCIFRVVDGISIYPQFHPHFKLISPMINHKILNIEKYKAAVDFLSYFIRTIERSVFKYEEPETSEYNRDGRETDKRGVFIRSHLRQPGRKAQHAMLAFVGDANENMVKGIWSMGDVKRIMIEREFSVYEQFACLSLLTVLVKVTDNMLTRIDSCKELRNKLREVSLKNELELFAFRSYIYVMDYKFPRYEPSFVMEGGMSAISSEIYRV